MRGLLVAICSALPERVYNAIPDLPRIRSRLLPIQDGNELVFNCFVFALRDSCTTGNLRSPLTTEHVEAVRKELGLPDDQQVKWVPIPTYVQKVLHMATL